MPKFLSQPRVVAIATNKNLKSSTPLADSVNLPGVHSLQLRYGQDITFGYNRRAPGNQDVGNTPAILKPKMRKLLSIFAAGDRSGMAARLFDAFLANHKSVIYFDDPALNAAAARHFNISYFCRAALNSPTLPHYNSTKHYIHQALKKADWDITKIRIPTDLGLPAFNLGIKSTKKMFNTEDFNNGLAVMINGVQHVYIVATGYHYDQAAKRYSIRLKCCFYDVFGLDDDDLREYGAKSDSMSSSDAAIGITAWWQLQHQHSYAPLVTRIILEKSYDSIPAL